MRVFINEHGYSLQMPDRSRRPASVEDVISVVLSSQLPPFVKHAEQVRALQVDSGVDCSGVSTCSPRVVARQLVKLLGPPIELAISAVCSRDEARSPRTLWAGSSALPAGDQEVELSWEPEDVQAAASETEAWLAMSSQSIKPAASQRSHSLLSSADAACKSRSRQRGSGALTCRLQQTMSQGKYVQWSAVVVV